MAGNGIYNLTIRSEFSASHRLRGHGGKCESPHGHNFGVEIQVQGRDLDPTTGMLVDFAILKKTLAQVLLELDHTDLNQHPAFAETSPSSERIACYIYKRLFSLLIDETPQARLISVTVSEKIGQSAMYSEL